MEGLQPGRRYLAVEATGQRGERNNKSAAYRIYNESKLGQEHKQIQVIFHLCREVTFGILPVSKCSNQHFMPVKFIILFTNCHSKQFDLVV